MPPTALTPAANLSALLRSQRFSWRSEIDLHNQIGMLLDLAHVPYRREVALAARDRIDFVVGRIGVEVKVGGSVPVVARQLQRYADSDQIDMLLLVTAVGRHERLPETIGGKPLEVCFLGWSAL